MFQNSDSSTDVNTLSFTAAERRASFSLRKCPTIDRSEPATLMACTDPNVSPSDSVTRLVASRDASR